MNDASVDMQQYFDSLTENVQKIHSVASKARSCGIDPSRKVETVLANTMAERVTGLVGHVAPQIINSGVSEAMEVMEKKYGILSIKVALKIAGEIAQEKFCSFPDKKTAMEIGIRTGFAYHTVGVVAAPLEGFVDLQIKKRRDGKEYLSPKFSGPIRGAGGTAIAVCLVIVDYIRCLFGYAPFDPSEEELKRYVTELGDYHDHVTNLQYNPSADEILFLLRRCPIEIDGDPTEEREVSNHKDLPRVATNRIRGGVCLVVSMLASKAPKLFRLISELEEFNVDWSFLEEFLTIQKNKKSQGVDILQQQNNTTKLSPDYTFISDLVAGRPIFGFPLRSGGFRLRYGRTRLSGFSATAIHPATMRILQKFIATGTQLKTERPGKATAITPCETIEGPIILLNDGAVLQIQTEEEAKRYEKDIKEILYLGDILSSYGDFYDRAHPLVPPGYCEEWHVLEFKEQAQKLFNTTETTKLSLSLGIDEPSLISYLSPCSSCAMPSWEHASLIAEKLSIPLHPHYTYRWSTISAEQLTLLYNFLGKHFESSKKKFILPLEEEAKRVLELIGLPHIVSQKEFIVIEENHTAALIASLHLSAYKEKIFSGDDTLLLVKDISCFLLQDKHGTTIGCRMGRPEKAKMRKMTGSPHVLFPVGEEGGRMRSFQAAIEKKRVTADFPRYLTKEGVESIYPFDAHGEQNTQLFSKASQVFRQETKPTDALSYSRREIPIADYYKQAMKQLSVPSAPKLVKGVRGTTNDEHIPEHLSKGILRALHDVFVNKDGTVRYDMSELPITHFTPEEINTPVATLLRLGYHKDYQGNPLTSPTQLVEIKPQDIVLPSSEGSLQENSDAVLLQVSNFVDAELTSLYGLKSFYNYKKMEDVVGSLVAGLAPHTSAAIVGRVIGFSKTQCFFAHPLFHAAMRRDADGDEACIVLLMDLFLNFSYKYLPSSRGARTMDTAIVLTSTLSPSEVDDMAHRLDVCSTYPLAFYEAAQKMQPPWSVKVELLGDRLGKPEQYENLSFTHHVVNMNSGVLLSAYKVLPTMQDKLKSQMELSEKIRAVDASTVAQMVIDKHFLKDIKGNLRRFGTQQFRCITCNKKFRRPPLRGNCSSCKGKIIFTVSEGSVVKYLEPALSLSEKYVTNAYTQQSLLLAKNMIEEVFGRKTEGQEALGKWFA